MLVAVSVPLAQNGKQRVEESVFVDENDYISTIILRRKEFRPQIVFKEEQMVIRKEIPKHVVKEETQTVFNVAEKSIVKELPQYIFDTKQSTIVKIEKEIIEKSPHILVFDMGTVAGNDRYQNQYKCFNEKKDEIWPTSKPKEEKQTDINKPMDSRQILLFRTANRPHFINKWPISEKAYPYESYFKRDPESIENDIKEDYKKIMLKQLETWDNVDLWIFSYDGKVVDLFKAKLNGDEAPKIMSIHLLKQSTNETCAFENEKGI